MTLHNVWTFTWLSLYFFINWFADTCHGLFALDLNDESDDDDDDSDDEGGMCIVYVDCLLVVVWYHSALTVTTAPITVSYKMSVADSRTGYSVMAIGGFNQRQREALPPQIFLTLKFVVCIALNIIEIVATQCHILRLKRHQIWFRLGSAPDPARGARSAHQTPSWPIPALGPLGLETTCLPKYVCLNPPMVMARRKSWIHEIHGNREIRHLLWMLAFTVICSRRYFTCVALLCRNDYISYAKTVQHQKWNFCTLLAVTSTNCISIILQLVCVQTFLPNELLMRGTIWPKASILAHYRDSNERLNGFNLIILGYS